MELKDLSSNWKKLQASLQQQKPKENQQREKPVAPTALPIGVKRKRSRLALTPSTKRTKNGKTPKMSKHTSAEEQPISQEAVQGIAKSLSRKSLDGGSTRPLTASNRENEGLAEDVDLGKYVSIDCEMVGVGPDPDKESALARVSAVNFNGDQIYDSYVRPKEAVTDWRTYVSGIQPKHMARARELEEVQKDIAQLLEGRILVGHAVRHDLDALLLGHPKRDIRDTAKHHPFRRYAGGGTPKLKILAAELLGLNIQSGEHSSVEDARACMLIFRREKDAFDREHSRLWRPQPAQTSNSAAPKPQRKKKNKKSKRS